MLKPPLQFRNNETPRATKITADRNRAKPIGQKQEMVTPKPKHTMHILRQSRSRKQVHRSLRFPKAAHLPTERLVTTSIHSGEKSVTESLPPELSHYVPEPLPDPLISDC